MQPARARERMGTWTDEDDDDEDNVDAMDSDTQMQTVDVVPPSSPNMTPLSADDGVVAVSNDHISPFLHPFIFAITKKKKERKRKRKKLGGIDRYF